MKTLKVISLVVLLSLTSALWAQQDSKKTDSNKNVIDEKLREDFSKAQPEDITNENFPQIIESFDYPNAKTEAHIA